MNRILTKIKHIDEFMMSVLTLAHTPVWMNEWMNEWAVGGSHEIDAIVSSATQINMASQRKEDITNMTPPKPATLYAPKPATLYGKN